MNVQAGSATLQFRGTADNGPAFSYFEYWKTADGPQGRLRTPTRTWPAGASGIIKETVAGLAASTNYTFRACGADSGRPAVCAASRDFWTRESDSLLVKNGNALELIGAPGFSQHVSVGTRTDQGAVRFAFVELAFNGIVPAPGSGCAIVPLGGEEGWPRMVSCSTAGITRIRAKLGDRQDSAYVGNNPVPFTLDGGAGDDTLSGAGGHGTDDNSEFMIGGPGRDTFIAAGGNDIINARDGEVDSVITCGENSDASSDADIAYVDANGELPLQGSSENCEDVRTTTPPPAP